MQRFSQVEVQRRRRGGSDRRRPAGRPAAARYCIGPLQVGTQGADEGRTGSPARPGRRRRRPGPGRRCGRAGPATGRTPRQRAAGRSGSPARAGPVTTGASAVRSDGVVGVDRQPSAHRLVGPRRSATRQQCRGGCRGYGWRRPPGRPRPRGRRSGPDRTAAGHRRCRSHRSATGLLPLAGEFVGEPSARCRRTAVIRRVCRARSSTALAGGLPGRPGSPRSSDPPAANSSARRTAATRRVGRALHPVRVVGHGPRLVGPLARLADGRGHARVRPGVPGRPVAVGPGLHRHHRADARRPGPRPARPPPPPAPGSAGRTSAAGSPAAAGGPAPARRPGTAARPRRTRWPSRTGGRGPSPAPSSRSSPARRAAAPSACAGSVAAVGRQRRQAVGRAQLGARPRRLLLPDHPQHLQQPGLLQLLLR